MHRFIVFFGPDGSGKSTHSELLLNYIKKHSRTRAKVKKVWIRSPHTLAYVLSLLFVKLGYYRIISNPYTYKKKLPAVHTNNLLKFFWSSIELISVIPLILFRVYIPLFLGYTIIAERYVVDTIVSIAYVISDMRFLQSRITRILLSFIPKNTIFIHLDSDYAELIKRRGYYVEPYNYIKFQRRAYKIMGKLLGTVYINTTDKSIEQSIKQIMYNLQINNCFNARVSVNDVIINQKL